MKPVWPAGRLGRAAVFASALAGSASVSCGGKQAPPHGPGDDKATPIAMDAGTAEAPPAPDAALAPDAVQTRPIPDDVPMPYGAPPARRRLV